MSKPSGSVVKSLPVDAGDTRDLLHFQSLGQEDPLEEEMATHSSVLAWEIPWTEGAWQATVLKVTKSWTQLIEHKHKFFASAF